MRRVSRVLLIAGLSLVISASVPAMGSAVLPGVGTGLTSISLLAVTGYVEGIGQSVELGAGSGLATTDPVRRMLASKTASVGFAAARAAGAQSIESSDFDISANADETKRTDGGSAFTLGLDGDETNVSNLAVVSVGIGTVSATVSDLFAYSSLSEITFAGSALSGLVDITGATAGITNESNAQKARASQGLYIESVKVFSLNEMLVQLGSSAAALEVFGTLADLGDDLGLPSDVTQPLRDAEAAYDEAEADEAAWNAAIAELTDGDLDVAADLAATETIAGMAVKYAAYLSGDPTDPMTVAATMGLVKTPLAAAVDAARSELAGTIGDLPLVTLDKVTAGVTAEAMDGTSLAASVVSWESARVASLDVPTLDSINDTIDSLTTMVTDVVNMVGDAVGLSLGVKVEIAKETEQMTTDGPYSVATAKLTLLDVKVNTSAPLAAPSIHAPGGFHGPAPDVVAGAQVLGLVATAEHRPGVSGGGPTGENGDGGGPLASTGFNYLWSVGGIGLIGLGLKLRRWLGDAA